MSFSAYKLWSFSGVTFVRVLSGDADPRWFVNQTLTAVDAVLGGTQRYVDIGGRDVGPITLRAMTDSTADRDSLIAKIGTSGTLTAASGDAGTAILTRVSSSAAGATGLWFLDLEFVFVS